MAESKIIRKLESFFCRTEQFLFPDSKFSILNLMNDGYIERKSIYEFIRKNAKFINGRVLDFGCGQKPYESLFKSNEYIGIDIKGGGHKDLDKKVDIFYNGLDIPFESKFFDSVVAFQCFEHIYNLDYTLLEINRVLKPNGTLMITLPLAWEEHEIPFDFFRFTQYGIKKLLVDNGFEILSVKKTNSYKDALRQTKINYYVYRGSIWLKFIIFFNNLLFELDRRNRKDNSFSNTIFSTGIGIICRKIK